MTSRREKRPCITLVILGLMRELDDFVTIQDLMGLTTYSRHQVHASLSHFMKYRIAERVESNGKVYFYLTHRDTRSRVVEERAVEDKPRHRRRVQAVQPTRH